MVKSLSSKVVYWVVGQALHPVNQAFFKEKGLQIFPVLNISERDLEKLPKGEAYNK